MTSGGQGRRMALLGVGYMGGSLALAARAAGLVDHVVGYDLDHGAAGPARAVGAIDEMVGDPASAARGAALVVLAGPVGAIAGLARDAQPGVAPDALVMDLGSVKQPIAEAVTASLGGARFVPCHPMAGIESVGVAAADATIFRGRACLLCPVASTAPAALSRARTFWEALGARILVTAADRHDVVMAAISHLPHISAFALSQAVGDATASAMGTGPRSLSEVGGMTSSLRDCIRIAGSSPTMWRDIFLANREALLPLIEEYEGTLGRLKQAMRSSDAKALDTILTGAQAARARLIEES